MIENIKLSKDDGTLIITMARPEKKNALTNATYGVRADAITSFDADPAARVLLLPGEGDMYTSG
jgi:enoyl-CoA hydratase/carnithine racemase